MHQHQQQHPQHSHIHQAIYARQQQQQQEANILFHQYNQFQLRPIQNGYSNPSLTYEPQKQQQQSQSPQQQLYRPDQLVPQTATQIPTPVQHQQLQQQLQQHVQQQIQQQMPRSSPVNMMQVSSTDIWHSGSPILTNTEPFRPISHTLSRTRLDIHSLNALANSIGSNPSSPPLNASFESPKTVHFVQGKQQSADNRRRRQRQHSGSSCYESDSPDTSSDDDDEYKWRLAKVNIVETLSSLSKKKRSNSMGRTDSQANEQESKDIYQKPRNNNVVFPAINNIYQNIPNKTNITGNRSRLIQYIDENIIGKDHVFLGPWGFRRMIYCDYTASGRPLEFIESYLRSHILPLYGNTHSETSLCAQQSTKFREEARNIIKKSVNGNDNDVLIFTGTGTTGAVHALVVCFDLHDETTRKNTVVIISAFEHHSNILPWKETGVELIRVPTTQHGLLDKVFLKEKLQHYAKLKKRIICSLNAASNITGIYTDVDSVSTLVHSFSGLIFWDYATAAPYVKIDMNPSATAYKDAVFISPHKFVGGPGTPGVLIAKKNLFSLKAPKSAGGGTVNYVTRTATEYNHSIEIREEGGTPDIIGCIRAGLVFQLKDSLDLTYIQAREDELVKRFFRRCKKLDNLILLGSQTVARLPIFSFGIYIPGVCKYLHHNLVCRLFNDLFGIQVRSGCACAGPYALDLLNVNDVKSDIYAMFMTEDVRLRGNDKIVRTMLMKPGFTRLNLPYFASDEEIDFIIDAVEFISIHGWKFLPLYTYDPTSGGWEHRSGFQLAQSSLEDITYKAGKMQYYARRSDSSPPRGEKNLPDPAREAKLLAVEAVRHAIETIDYTSDPPLNVPDKYKNMVWFALPIDIALMMIKQNETGQESNGDIHSIPFIPDDAKAKLLASSKAKSTINVRDAALNKKKPSPNNLSSSTSRMR
ncbi:unnamed protein product [Adineta steineri]|uniref:Aminotransferase class V domain-containing protein n=1 Tax=Adineta steineri TaxID=433720 RepID=A0A819GJW4_9BILA|nr:unnamed protein product [Adineta steineri]CAF3880947.1 unnamed protein product [Adineta steineri]